MEVITRKQAKEQGLKHYFTGKPCKHGHVRERKTYNGACLGCECEFKARIYKANPDFFIDKANKWRLANLDRKRAANARWRANHPNHQPRLPKSKEERNAQRKRWEEKNPGASTERAARRRARLRHAKVKLNQHERKQLKAIYHLRDELTKQMGSEFHVDHRIPLSKGGKHHPSNLWVIPAIDNLKKCAKMPEELAA